MPHTASAFVRGSSWHHQLQAGTRALSQKVRRGAHPCRARGPTWRGPQTWVSSCLTLQGSQQAMTSSGRPSHARDDWRRRRRGSSNLSGYEMSVQGRQRASEGEIRGVDAKLPRRVAVAAVGLWLQTVAVHDALGFGLPVNEDLTSANLRAKLDARPGELRRAAGGAGITQVFAGNDAKQV